MFVRQIQKAWVVVMGLVFVLAGITLAAEEKPETPTALKGSKIISAEEAKALLDKKEANFFDVRSPVNYGKGHIPTAVSLPYKEKSAWKPDFNASLDEFDLSKLPKDKNAKIVVYSDGTTGWKSYKAAVIAIKAGYKNVMYYRGGFDEWEKKGYPVER
ncbi:MAG: rhodanese-like domain-containing protein [Nitrospirae bacterium]|nr:rhodanese-like domain-containing protein [Nitrospirota bacterium]